jgi:hypothetical protein
VTPSGTVLPQFLQQASSHAFDVASLAVTPGKVLTIGNRLVVEVGVWNAVNATATGVKDSAGDSFTELMHFKAADGTEMSVWTAPVSASGGANPVITVTPSSPADVGAALLEYSGLSTATGTALVDQAAQATGTTKAAAGVFTPHTPPTSGPNELVVGFYVDSGFGDALGGGPGYTVRTNVSPDGDMEFLVEDALTGPAGATPSVSAETGASTVWLMAAMALKPASAG